MHISISKTDTFIIMIFTNNEVRGLILYIIGLVKNREIAKGAS